LHVLVPACLDTSILDWCVHLLLPAVSAVRSAVTGTTRGLGPAPAPFLHRFWIAVLPPACLPFSPAGFLPAAACRLLVPFWVADYGFCVFLGLRSAFCSSTVSACRFVALVLPFSACLVLPGLPACLPLACRFCCCCLVPLGAVSAGSFHLDFCHHHLFLPARSACLPAALFLLPACHLLHLPAAVRSLRSAVLPFVTTVTVLRFADYRSACRFRCYLFWICRYRFACRFCLPACRYACWILCRSTVLPACTCLPAAFYRSGFCLPLDLPPCLPAGFLPAVTLPACLPGYRSALPAVLPACCLHHGWVISGWACSAWESAPFWVGGVPATACTLPACLPPSLPACLPRLYLPGWVEWVTGIFLGHVCLPVLPAVLLLFLPLPAVGFLPPFCRLPGFCRFAPACWVCLPLTLGFCGSCWVLPAACGLPACVWFLVPPAPACLPARAVLRFLPFLDYLPPAAWILGALWVFCHLPACLPACTFSMVYLVSFHLLCSSPACCLLDFLPAPAWCLVFCN